LDALLHGNYLLIDGCFASFHLLIDSPRWRESKDMEFTVAKQMKTRGKTEFTIGQYLGNNYIPIANIPLKTEEPIK